MRPFEAGIQLWNPQKEPVESVEIFPSRPSVLRTISPTRLLPKNKMTFYGERNDIYPPGNVILILLMEERSRKRLYLPENPYICRRINSLSSFYETTTRYPFTDISPDHTGRHRPPAAPSATTGTDGKAMDSLHDSLYI